jgi:hypothetical protein
MPSGPDPMAVCRDLATALAGAETWQDASALTRQWRAAVDRHADAVEGPPGPAPGPASAPTATARPDRARVQDDGRVGIWVPQMIDGETWFVRDPAVLDPETLWAHVERIGPKRDRRRIVFLGESCARAFPLDPLFNCVAALRIYLGSVAGGDEVEIVDLAHCGITPGPLVGMIDAARALDPDVFVIFAGNNWQVSPQRLDFPRLGSTLAASGSWRAIAPELDRAVRTQVADWMTAIAEACRRAGTPALFVIPAQNQRDGWLPATRYHPLLTSQDQARREELIARMEAWHAAGEVTRADAVAAELVALEDGFSIAGLQGLARSALARGAADEAARLFEQGREMLVYLPLSRLDSYTTRIDEMRAAASREHLPIVDLPCAFRQMNEGRLPGRDLFLDRVHMTARGVVLAMAATAEALMPLLDLPVASRDDLLAVPIDVEPRAEAQAHVYFAQYMMPQDPDLSRYHCRQAIARTPEAAEVMRHYADLLMRRVPFVLSDAFHQLQRLEARFPGLRGLQRRALDTHQNSVTADTTLARFLMEAIAEADPDDGGREMPDRALARFEAVVRAQNAVGPRDVDLLRCTAADEALDGVPAHDRAYMKCFRREIHFVVTSPAAAYPFRVSLTARSGHARMEGPVEGQMEGRTASLRLNGEPLQTWPVSRAWRTIECVAPAALVRDGINQLTVIWPDPDEPHEDRLRLAVVALANRKLLGGSQSPDVFTIYGEIAAFTARSAVDAIIGQGPAVASRPSRDRRSGSWDAAGSR